MPELPDPSLVPFVVAVTGHRDLRTQDLDALRVEVRSVFQGMRKRMPKTPLVLLTALAEGADQLVTDVALEEKVFVVAALPMPLDIYRSTMSEPAQKKLDEQLALSIVRMTLPLEGRTPEQIRASEDVKASCYESLALFLARQGQALIALWDGKHSNKRGGTYHVVHYVRSGALKGTPEEVESHCGIVYQVVSPRMSGSEPAHKIRTVRLGCEHPRVGAGDGVTSPEEEALAQLTFEQVEANFERFNNEVAEEAKKPTQPLTLLVANPDVPLSPFLKRLQTLYGRADAISVGANKERKKFLTGILFFAVAGTLFYSVQGEMFGESKLLWLTFPLFAIVALLLHRKARSQYVEAKYLDARAFAEALRVQFFWEMAGIEQPVDRYYLMNHRTELDWIRFALKNIWLLHSGLSEDSAAQPNCSAVLEHWVKDQEHWYRVNAVRQSQSVRLREKGSVYSLIFSVGLSVLFPVCIVIATYELRHRSYLWNPGSWLYAGLHVLVAVPALLVAAYRLWIEQVGYEEQSREYRYMGKEFEIKAKKLAEHLNSLDIAQSLLLQLGIEALKENGRWLLLHRERPLEVMSTP
jgi:hypothetical protein